MSKRLDEILGVRGERKVVLHPWEHLSVSSMSTGLKCERQCGYRYAMGLKSPPGAAMVFGGKTSVALNTGYNEIIRDGKTSAGLIVDVFAESFKEVSREVEWQREPQGLRDKMLKQGDQLLRLYHKTHMVKQEPVGSEVFVEYNLPGVRLPIIGYIDLLEDGKITDHKTSDKKKADWKEPRRSLQLGFYGLAKNVDKVAYHGLVRHDSDPKIDPHWGTLTDYDKRWLEGSLRRIANATLNLSTDQRDWSPCNPHDWWCSEKWCGYWQICRNDLAENG